MTDAPTVEQVDRELFVRLDVRTILSNAEILRGSTPATSAEPAPVAAPEFFAESASISDGDVPAAPAAGEIEMVGNHNHSEDARAMVVPDGYVLVPREPTEAMVGAGYDAWMQCDAGMEDYVTMYSAMLAAAPSAPVAGKSSA